MLTTYALSFPTLAAPALAVIARLSLDARGYRIELSSTTSGEYLTPANVDVTKILLTLSDRHGRLVLGPGDFQPQAPQLTPGDDQRTLTRVAYTYASDKPIATPGLYSVGVRFGTGAFHRNGSELLAEQVLALNVYVNESSFHPPGLTPGQRFLPAAAFREATGLQFADPADIPTAMPLVDTVGTVIRSEQIGLRSVVLQHVDTGVSPHVLTFLIDGGGIARLRSDANVTDLPGLIPLVDDGTATALDRTHAGRPVSMMWQFSDPCAAALTVEHFYRAYHLPTHFRQLGYSPGGDDGASAYNVMNPLVVILEPHTAADPRCEPSIERFADTWDFKRKYSFDSMTAMHPDWSPAVIDRILKRQVRVGMTHEMIAWMFGYPTVFGSLAELDRLPEWEYEASAPSSQTVYFRGDSVTRYDPPGQMP